MNLFCSCVFQKLNNIRTGCTVNNRIINNDYSFALNSRLQHIEPDFQNIFSLRNFSLCKGPADIFVLDKRNTVGYARFYRISQCRRKSAVRYTADHISLNGMLLCKNSACLLPCHINRHAINNAVGSGDIDILKKTQRAFAAAVILKAAYAVFINYNDLARLDITDKLSSKTVESAGFGRYHIAAALFSDAKRSEAVRVTHTDEHTRRGKNKRISTLKLVHCVNHRFFNRRVVQAQTCDNIGNKLCI